VTNPTILNSENAADSISVVEQARQNREDLERLKQLGLLDRYRAIEACKANPAQPAILHTLLFNKQYLQIDLREVVSQHLYLYGAFEENLTAFLLEFLKPGMVFADIGAHFGYFSVVASPLVGEEGRVVSFEPSAQTFQRLSINVSKLPNTVVHRKAAWNRNEEIEINSFGRSSSAFNSVTEPRAPPGAMRVVSRERVPAVRLDDAFPEGDPQPSVIKIDVESSEMQVLEGMPRLLEKVRPAITIEVGDMAHLIKAGVPSSRALLNRLLEHEYSLYDYESGLKPHTLKGEGEYSYDNVIALPKELAANLMSP
jgi:FkbM family methyltransferase